ncbi:ABC transporter ATP-binding protein [Stutzerimonas zhaodongensis]|jgi:ATP-binding cassette subfamily B protein|uniref:ABC transporter ATP-binding protein n=1 Tax=Stutzerimonas zhaodongensis TaxID=1176257 RepID=A0A365PZ29_9GAMM|nr:ABC transporter ATP-binding protein [Stutzerimonas zhaodongensis]RBA62187.1 ABC transporter ATP-binding protein [Stutzerimonas zhaodongensis]
MKTELSQYRRALALTRTYYPKAISLFAIGTLILLALALLNATVPVLLRDATNRLSAGEVSGVVLATAAVYALCWTGAQVLEWTKNIISAAVLVRCDAAFYRAFFDHLLKVPYADFRAIDQGVLVADAQRSKSAFSALTGTLFWIVLPTVVELLFVFAVLAKLINPLFAVSFISAIIVLVGLSVLLSRKAKGIHQRIIESNNGVMSHFVERMRLVEEIKLNNAQPQEQLGFGRKVRTFIDSVTVGNLRIGLLMLLQVALVGALLLASTLYVVGEVISGSYTVGDFVMINGYVIQLTFQLALLASVLIEVRNHFVQLDRGFGYLDMAAERTGELLPDTDQDILFELRDLSYRTEDRVVLRDINLTIRQGHTYVVTGPSGAGKTTLLRLMCGLIQPQQGIVRAFGVEVNALDSRALLDAVSVVTQHPLLVSGSVAANIRYGAKQDLTEPELDQILTDLGLDAYATGKNMAGKHVGFEATAVSGGEKQRIAIARALARGTPTILLDEPTSALDAASEEQTIEMLKKRARTLILITHRPSVVAKADYVIHLNGDGSACMTPHA